MPRPPIVTVADAAARGVSWDSLQTRRWRRVHVGVYAASRLPESAEVLLDAIRRRLPDQAVFSGRTAAWVHGWAAPLSPPIEFTVPPSLGVTRRSGMVVHRAWLDVCDITVRRGYPVTSALRTAADLASGRDLVESVVLLDAALGSKEVTLTQLEEVLAERCGRKGAARLRRALQLAEPLSESPMETRLRLLLILNGLPAPVAQAELRDRDGSFIGRVDLYYSSARLCIEYDGSTHRATLREDNRRQNRLLDAGYRLLRFTAADLARPDLVVALVRHALRQSCNSD